MGGLEAVLWRIRRSRLGGSFRGDCDYFFYLISYKLMVHCSYIVLFLHCYAFIMFLNSYIFIKCSKSEIRKRKWIS